MTQGEPSSGPDEAVLFDEDLCRLARRLSADALEADDLLQDAWLASQRSGVAKPSNRKHWFAAVLVNLARMRRRAESRRVDHERRASREEASEPDEPDSDALDRLRASVGALREPYRDVVLLHHFEGLTFPEIAARLGRSEGTLRSQHQRALEILRGHRPNRAQGLVALLGAIVRRRRGARRASAAAAVVEFLAKSLLPAGAIAALAVVLFMTLQDREPGTDALAFELEPDPAARPTRLRAPDSIGRSGVSDVPKSGSVRSSSVATPPPEQRTATLPEGEPRTIRVAVRDPSGGPIPLAQVGVRAPSAVDARKWTTDAEGRVEIPITAEMVTCDAGRERIQVAAFADGWATRFETLVSTESDASPAVEIALETTEMRLEGKVIDRRGQPIIGATVVATPARTETIAAGDGIVLRPLSHSATTRPDGRFTIAWIPHERRRLQVLRHGIVVHESTIEAARASEEILVQLEDAAILSGTVRHPDRRPAARAHVFWERFSQPPSEPIETDDEGRFRLEGVPPGWVRVWATWPSSYEAATEVVLLEPGRERTWDADLAPRAPLIVRASTRSGLPITCARVDFIRWAPQAELPTRTAEEHLRVFDTWSRSAFTDDQGRAVLHPAPDRPIEARVFLAALSSALPAFVERGLMPGAGEREVRLDPSRQPASVSGSVVDADGRPFADAMIAICDAATSSIMYVPADAADGSFRAQGLPPSTFGISVAVPGRGAIDLGVFEVTSGQSYDVGRITTLQQARLAIHWRWPEGGSASRRFTLCQQTRRNGVQVPISLEVGSLPPVSGFELFPGVYSLHVNESGRLVQFRVFSVPPGSAIEVESGPDERFLWPIRITSEPSRSFADATVVVRRSGEIVPYAERSFSTAPDGAASGYLSLPPGAYEVEASTSDGRRGEATLKVSEDDLIRTLAIVLR